MKKVLNILLIMTLCLFFLGCKEKPVPKEQFRLDKAVIYYNSSMPPWGILKIAAVAVEDFLSDGGHGLNQIVITDKDSLQYITEQIIHAKLDTLDKNNRYVDTSIAMLLYSGNKIDTLASNAYPQSRLQYNNTTFRDSLLVYYLIDAIRQRDSIWNHEAEDYYYDGQYQSLPKSFWIEAKK